MSKNNTEKPTASTAASAPYSNEFGMRAPPPTYEESQRMQVGQAAASNQQHLSQPPLYPPIAGNQYYGMTHHEQLPRGLHVPGYHTAAPNYGAYNFQQQAAPGPSGIHQLTLDARAEIRTTASGAIVVPPPPPGCAPTPGQLAAMQGQPVVVKQKKRTFF